MSGFRALRVLPNVAQSAIALIGTNPGENQNKPKRPA
jgi:hypothetical protein